MNRVVSLLSVIALLMGTAAAQAANRACLLEGSLKLGKQVIEIKDCVQNNGVSESQLKQACQSIADIGAGMGAPPKVSYLNRCPTPAQGACDGLFGPGLAGYYYKRSAKDLADTQASCQAMGGRWSAGK